MALLSIGALAVLAVVGLALERMTTKEWTETDARVHLVIDAAWAAIAGSIRAGCLTPRFNRHFRS